MLYGNILTLILFIWLTPDVVRKNLFLGAVSSHYINNLYRKVYQMRLYPRLANKILLFYFMNHFCSHLRVVNIYGLSRFPMWCTYITRESWCGWKLFVKYQVFSMLEIFTRRFQPWLGEYTHTLIGTVSRDWDGLIVVRMEKAIVKDESLIIFVLIFASWFVTLNFTFFRGIAQRLLLCVQLGQPFCNVPKVVSNPLTNFLQGVRGYWQPSGKFVTGCQRLLATLWQIL
jgi:hypothetical protein